MATQPFNFVLLPADVQLLILSFVLRPKDLISLCLVSKHVRDIAIRHLYRKVVLDVGGPADHKLSAFLSPGNPGLQHVRAIALIPKPPHARGLDKTIAFAVKMILEFLPSDCLDEFRWPPGHVCGAENVELLFRKQRRLKLLQAVALEQIYGPELQQKLHLDSVVTSRVKALDLFPSSKYGLEFSHELLKRKTDLSKLTIFSSCEPRLRLVDHDNALDDDATEEGSEADEDQQEDLIDNLDNEDFRCRFVTDLNDSATRPGQLTKTLFRHMLPFEKCTPMLLKDLTLNNVYLRYCQSSFCQVIDMPNLEALRVLDCSGPGALFAALCRSPLTPKSLKILQVQEYDDSIEGELMHALNDFLPLVAGIIKLSIDVRGPLSLPDTSGIAHHGETLRVLSLHTAEKSYARQQWVPGAFEPENEMVYTTANFRAICRACTQLRELSVAFPRTSITTGPSASYQNFLSSISQHLHHLVTLQITNWPDNSDLSSLPSGQMSPKLYNHLLQAIAQDIFEADQPKGNDGAVTRRPDSAGSAGSAGSSESDESHTTTLSMLSTPPPPPPSPPLAPSAPAGHLRLVAWGTPASVHARTGEKMHMTIFAAGRTIDPLGGPTKVSATRIAWAERRWWEPESIILDWPIKIRQRPPVTEIGDGGDGDYGMDMDEELGY